MFNTEVYIINNKCLYDLLDELKNQFIFKIFHFQNKDDFLEYFSTKTIENFLILSSKDLKIKIDKNRFLIINNFPVKILKLIQNINIKILQSTFNFKFKRVA